MPNVGPGFYQKLLEVADSVQMKPEDILNVMAVESGISPTAHNPGGDASGLLQFMPATLRNLGFRGTHAEFRTLSAEDQLDFVKKLILSNEKYNGGPFRSASQYYVANFLPLALKLPGIRAEEPSTIIVAKNPDKPHLPGISVQQEAVFYRSNPGLDFDHDGLITYGDIQNVLKRAAGGKNFQQALAQMQKATGYSPHEAPPSMVATKDDFYKRMRDKYKGQDMYGGLGVSEESASGVEQVLEQYLHQIAASEKQYKKLYKKFLPANHMTIQIAAPTFTDQVEFARILCSVLDIELLATAFTHTNGKRVEVQCSVPGPEAECVEATRQLTESTAQAFELATRKLGGIKVTTKLMMNKTSSYQQISLHTAESNYRKFLLKFV